MPPGGGGAEGQPPGGEAEALVGLRLGDAEYTEDLLLDLRPMDTDRPAADLRAVEHHVVGPRAHRAGVGEVARRHGERVVDGIPAALAVVPFEGREAHDPERLVAPGRHELEAARELEAQLTERGRGDRSCV